MEEAAYTRGSRGGYNFLGQARMHGTESLAAVFVEDADQIDDNIRAGEQSRQGVRIVYISSDQPNCVKHPQGIVAGDCAGGDADPVAVFCELGD
jgi:hypothetical protein